MEKLLLYCLRKDTFVWKKDSVLSFKEMKPRGNQTINKVDGFSRKTGRETKEKLRN